MDVTISSERTTYLVALVALLLGVAVSSGPLVAQTVGGQAAKSRSFQEDEVKELYDGSYALLVGITKYKSPKWNALPSISKDIDGLGAALKEHGFTVETALDLTGAQLRDQIRSFIARHHSERSRLLLFFAGHGHTRRDGERGYFVPADAPTPDTDETAFLATALPMTEVEEYAKQMEVLHALIIFDSCFSGTIFQSRDAISLRPISKDNRRPVRQFLSAGDKDQTVPAVSVFTDVLIRALAGEADLDNDGYVTGNEIGFWVRSKVIEYTHNTQTPQFGKVRDANLDRGDVVFVARSHPNATGLAQALERDPRNSLQQTPATPSLPSPVVSRLAILPPESAAYDGPTSGRLSYNGPPVPQNGEIIFNNLPPATLKLEYDTGSWTAQLARNTNGTQRLVLRSKKSGTQTKADVVWTIAN